MFDQLLLRQAGDHVAEDGIAVAVVFSVDLMATGVCFYSSFWYKCEDFENPDLKDTELLNTKQRKTKRKSRQTEHLTAFDFGDPYGI